MSLENQIGITNVLLKDLREDGRKTRITLTMVNIINFITLIVILVMVVKRYVWRIRSTKTDTRRIKKV